MSKEADIFFLAWFIFTIALGTISASAGYAFLLLSAVIYGCAKDFTLADSYIACFFAFTIVISIFLSFSTAINIYVFGSEILKLVAFLFAAVILYNTSAANLAVGIQAATAFILVNIASFNLNHESRLEGFFIHANHLAYFACICLYANLVYRLKGWLWGSLVCLLAIFLTRSSGGIILMLYILFYYYIATHKSRYLNIFFYSISFLIATWVFYQLGAFSSIAEKFAFFDDNSFAAIYDKASRQSFGSEGSLIWRMTYWTAILNEFFASDLKTLLLGEGLASMSKDHYVYPFMDRDPHNDFVRLIVERGLLGATIVMSSFFLIMRKYKSPSLIVLLSLPMLSGNVIVSFPTVLIYITLVCYHEKTSFSYALEK